MAADYITDPKHQAIIQGLVESGRFAKADDVIAEGIRLVEAQEEMRQLQRASLRIALREGMESGSASPEDEVFARLEARLPRKSQNE